MSDLRESRSPIARLPTPMASSCARATTPYCPSASRAIAASLGSLRVCDRIPVAEPQCSRDSPPPGFRRGRLGSAVVLPERPADLVDAEAARDAGEQLHSRRLGREEACGDDL